MDYKETLNLPKTNFPMKANLTRKEPELIARWGAEEIYQDIRRARADARRFILHDGPPYANGAIHTGTALNKILKDIVIKSRSMMGFDAPYKPGWDCHGLPIELNVDRQLGEAKRSMSQTEIRAQCRAYANKFIDVQRDQFKRLGVFGDWENPYLTLSKEYEVGIIEEFGALVRSGAVYRADKPIHWCPSCVTALAEAEVEYHSRQSPSIVARFELDEPSAAKLGYGEPTRLYALIWTTTPWTLPANRALAFHPAIEYGVYDVGDDTRYIVATELAADLFEEAGIKNARLEKTAMGNAFERLNARHPFIDIDSLMILADHVTLERGSGIVHTAPGHGQEDYLVGTRYDLEVYNPIDRFGRFKESLKIDRLVGRSVWEGNEIMLEILKEKEALILSSTLEHSYPHCWRCRNPIIFRATPQWFISMSATEIRRKAIEQIGKVDWIPASARERIESMVESRPDWCLSRQRAWGVPVVAVECAECGEPKLSPRLIDRVIELARSDERGIDIWFDRPLDSICGPEVELKCDRCSSSRFRKSEDILDVWFDSGVSHALVAGADERLGWPVDLYLEGSDQHRGWFQTSLLHSVGTREKAPYRSVLTHGYVVDGAGRKMSKSLGNQIDPNALIEKYGAEIVRLWVSSVDYRVDVRISDEIFSRLVDAYRKIRNTLRFALGNLSDFDPDEDYLPTSERDEIDRLIVARSRDLNRKIVKAYEEFNFHLFYHQFHNFCSIDLSSFYFQIIKDRLYTHPRASLARRAAQSTIYDLSSMMIRLMAPVLSFTAEEAWGELRRSADEAQSSVHLTLFPTTEKDEDDARLKKEWERLSLIRSETLKALEEARRAKIINHSLDAKVRLSAFEADFALARERVEFLPFFFDVSQVELTTDSLKSDCHKSEVIPGLSIAVEPASGVKCARCWNHSEDVDSDRSFPGICARCAENLRASEKSERPRTSAK